MMFSKKVIGAATAVLLSIGMIATGATAAQAASGTLGGCTVTSNKPYKSGSQIRGTGAASCSTTASRTLYLELHRSEGWWHPMVATGSNSGAKKSYSVAGAGCDDGNTHNYFTEVGWGGSEINSGNSGSLAGTC